jgi:hypothetical protein
MYFFKKNDANFQVFDCHRKKYINYNYIKLSKTTSNSGVTLNETFETSQTSDKGYE